MSITSADIINLNEQHGKTVGSYKNFDLTIVNNHIVRMSIMNEDFYWHYHPNSDETFIVIEGTLLIDLQTGTIELNNGQMITIPKSIPHRTRPKNGRSVNLTIELSTMETVRFTENNCVLDY